jgi:hypothetical protein
LVGPWWIYLAVAGPLTLVVVVLWFIWRRSRLQRKQWLDLEAGMRKEKDA